MWSKTRARSWARNAGVFVAAAAIVQVAAIAPALANAPNPNPDISATATVNANGTVTVNLTGTWAWPGQNCEGRYGEGWAVDWWGISSSQTPANPFTLTDASIVTAAGSTTTGDEAYAGAIALPQNAGYFHVGTYYDGEDVNSASTCTDTGSGPSAGSTGSWSAAATYPSQSDVPASICVNMYDEHGSEGQPAGGNNFSPTQDNDNSIQTNSFNPQAGMGYCSSVTVMQPGITLLKQVCTVSAAQCSASVSSDWASSHEIPSGTTAVWKLTITDSGNTKLSDVTVTDALASGCAGATSPSSLSPGGSVVVSCDSLDVTKGFTNVATVTGTPPSGANVTATSNATVSVTSAPPGITTSQSLTPNDEGFIGQEGTGKMTFSLFPPGNSTCHGTPAYTQTVTVNMGIAETTNTSFIAHKAGTWRWLVSYTGNDGSATAPCGAERFTIVNG